MITRVSGSDEPFYVMVSELPKWIEESHLLHIQDEEDDQDEVFIPSAIKKEIEAPVLKPKPTRTVVVVGSENNSPIGNDVSRAEEEKRIGAPALYEKEARERLAALEVGRQKEGEEARDEEEVVPKDLNAPINSSPSPRSKLVLDVDAKVVVSYQDVIDPVLDAKKVTNVHGNWDTHTISNSKGMQDVNGPGTPVGTMKTHGLPTGPSPFPVQLKLNEKIHLWLGDVATLKVGAIVNSTNEALSYQDKSCKSIYTGGGKALEQHILDLQKTALVTNEPLCCTGETCMTPAFDLPSKHIFHTVAPKYSDRFQTAAANALHGCYRRSLELLIEQNERTIGFCVLHIEKKNYPAEAAANIACRTLRRFLELFGQGIDSIVLAMPSLALFEVYQKVLPLYFPRSQKEFEWAGTALPEDVGNHLGEVEDKERAIRISGVPLPTTAPAASTTNGSSSMKAFPFKRL